MYKIVSECRICKSKKLVPYLDLGNTPLANALLDEPRDEYEAYPLKVLFCEECALSQLSIVVDPIILYSHYKYHSSVSSTFKDHCKNMAIEIKKLFEPWVQPMVLDIASNDGCLLEQFKAQGYYVMGVEPCKELADEANSKKISTVNGFFNEDSCKRIPALDVITATNVFAHVEDIRTFLNLAKSKLREISKGFIVIEVPYLVNLINDNQFDTVYHEHLSYFLLKPLMRLFKDCDMEIFKVEEHPIHGGSLRVYGSKIGTHIEHPSVSELEQYEEINGFYDIEKYKEYYLCVKELVGRFKVVIQTIVLDGKKIAGYGASAKGIMLLSASGINCAEIRYVVDDTVEKQGKFIPKSNIPIVDFSMFEKDKPDYIVIMSWNFADELMEKTKHLGCKYIVPIPEVKIL